MYGGIDVLLTTTVPLLVVVFAVAVVMGMAATGGPLFSFENVKLDLEHVSPMGGAKRIFSSRNVIEFVKSLAKVVVLTTAFWMVLRGFIPPLFQTPSCGEACLGRMVVSTLQPLAITAVIAFVIIGVLDMPFQRYLFLKQMRMSLTEKKREMKEQDGSPEIQAQRRRLQRREHARGDGARPGAQENAFGDVQWILTFCRKSSACKWPISRSRKLTPSLIDTAAATPAPWPVTVQHIMLRTAACEISSPAMQRPATSRFSILCGNSTP